MGLFRRRIDDRLLELFEEAGGNAQRASVLLRDLISDYPERSGLARDLLLCEQEGDRIAHDVIRRLKSRGSDRGWLDPVDGYQLATAIDDVVDFAEQAADHLGLYAVEAPMEQSVALADVLVGAAEQVARALKSLRAGAEMSPHLVEIHRFENEGDRLVREGVATLFADGIDPMVVIRWKDIYESLESSVDACEKVAHVLEGISLRR